MKLDSGKYCWTMSPEQYVKAVITNVEEDLARSGKRLPLKCVTPLSRNYSSWLEYLPDLIADGVQLYQEFIHRLKWAVAIRRLDILLSIYVVMPWVGHLEQAYHTFGYLKAHPKRKLGFDLAYPAINERSFRQCNCTEFYRDADEAIPGKMKVARGNFMRTHCFVNSNHACDTDTRRYQTGIILF